MSKRLEFIEQNMGGGVIFVGLLAIEPRQPGLFDYRGPGLLAADSDGYQLELAFEDGPVLIDGAVHH